MTDRLTGQEHPRERIVDRLFEDLIGPREVAEVLKSRPSDVYLTGILWPKNTFVPPEENEQLSVSPGDRETGEESAESGQAAAVPLQRPSAAGISFAVRTTQGGAVPRVQVRVSFGLYAPETQDGRTVWRRTVLEPQLLPLELVSGAPDIYLNVGPAGLRLNIRAVLFERGVLATVTLVNDATPAAKGRNPLEEVTLFQVQMDITAGAHTQLVARPDRRAIVDHDDESAALLYQRACEFAAGHTCSATWDEPPESDRDITYAVRTTWLPDAMVPAVSLLGHKVFRDLAKDHLDPLSADWLAAADTPQLVTGLNRLCDAYQDWLVLKEKEALEVPASLAATADRHLRTVRSVLERMRSGVQRLERDREAAAAFRLANLAMSTQARWNGNEALRWRPFQLGFVILTFGSSIDGGHPDRGVMDLLWFPTGGGKTEAYLALIAIVAFFRRLSRAEPDDGAGVAVIMRYTLRLLTTQQFMRASAMICACEAIRRGVIPARDAGGLGNIPFSIGLWVGAEATPNKRNVAFETRTDLNKPSPRQLLDCPACRRPLHYAQRDEKAPVEVHCRNAPCILSRARLPVWTVDEDVFEFRPTLLVGTVDKFAQIVRNPNTAALFGVGTRAQPQLILQDELHLISGPLGTVSGLYESAIDLILSADGYRPKIIGSTATIRRAPEQVLALFDRETCQFPPPGLEAADSGFAVIDQSESAPGRRYVGVSTTGRSAKFTLQAVAATLLQSAQSLGPAERNHYWTLIAYFNSLRELGGAVVLMQDDVNDAIRLLHTRRGEPRRMPRAVEELTSNRTQQEVRFMLHQLEVDADKEGALDVVLATNMISVGVDIKRLGLMVVNGQPKTMSEYIQATSRVGRGGVAGLVVPVLNAAKPRDRSHFETFRTWHATLYREVEATSVTPFASRARDRALHAVLVAAIRHLIRGMLHEPQLNDKAVLAAEDLIKRIAERAARVDPLETDVGIELRERLRRWVRRSPVQYWKDGAKDSLLQSAETAASRRASGRGIGQAWPTPNTMRAVEPGTPYRLTERLKADHNGQ